MSSSNPSASNPVRLSPTSQGAGQLTSKATSPKEDFPDDFPVDFPIVALGASAGGLEALEQFFQAMPGDTGMGFVVIQHLDPDRKALMPELLQRLTSMKVGQAKDQTRISPNCVYVLPPNKEMSVLHGVLHLFEPTDDRGHRLPIDSFFISLARDRKDKAIGVILSGMGSDGTLGLRAIREHGGLTLAQAPDTAKFDSMPRSVIDANLADRVHSAAELPAALQTLVKHPGLLQASAKPGTTCPNIEKALVLLRDRSGHDFSAYKTNTIRRRIERRMLIHRIDTLDVYIRYLRENPAEVDLLFKELLIGVTSFFRDPEVWDRLKETLTPILQARAREGGTFRAWVAGCSTGEEAYTLAMIIREALDTPDGPRPMHLQIFASDLNKDAIGTARRGRFPAAAVQTLSPERRERFFQEEKAGFFRVRTEIRGDMLFSVHSLITDPPFTRLDLVTCRNVLIYLIPEMQGKLVPLFHYSLHPGGLLLLGNAESLGLHAHLLADVDGPLRLYRKLMSAYAPDLLDFPTRRHPHTLPDLSGDIPGIPMSQNLQTLAENLILQHYAPATVLVDELGNILHISGRTGHYLEPAAGKANWNLFPMAREGLRIDLHRCFTQAMAAPGLASAPGICLEEAGLQHFLDLGVERLTGPGPLKDMLIVLFRPVAAPKPRKTPRRGTKGAAAAQHLKELESELADAREALRNDQVEMQRYREDLRASMEELQSTNEELQSSNEELTTSKEEMQSLNEELQTVNAELQEKLDGRTGDEPETARKDTP